MDRTHTHDDPKAAMEYAALLLEQDDAGGTLPGLLRQYARTYADLLAACEALLQYIENDADALGAICDNWPMVKQARAAIAKARGETS